MVIRSLLKYIVILSVLSLFGCQILRGREEHTRDLPVITNFRIIHTSCIVDQPLGIKRYTIVTTHGGGFGEKTLEVCQKRFKDPKMTDEKETFQAFNSSGEFEITYTLHSTLSCTVVKLNGIPSPLYIVSVLEPRFLQRQIILHCLLKLEEEHRRQSERMEERFSPQPKPKFQEL